MNKKAEARAYKSKTISNALSKITPEQQKRTAQKMLLASKIADAVDAIGWTRKEFAEKMGKHPSEITKWLSGTHNFTSDTLFEIQEVLGIRIIELESAISSGPKYEMKITVPSKTISWPFYHEFSNLLRGPKTASTISWPKQKIYA
jgi:transcriptional regulator with XRE-family HTH domain